jgi:hypothetical protein
MLAMLRTAGPPTDRATGARNCVSRSAATALMVTPAPMMTRSASPRIWRRAGSVERMMVVIDRSPSLIARIT